MNVNFVIKCIDSVCSMMLSLMLYSLVCLNLIVILVFVWFCFWEMWAELFHRVTTVRDNNYEIFVISHISAFSLAYLESWHIQGFIGSHQIQFPKIWKFKLVSLVSENKDI